MNPLTCLTRLLPKRLRRKRRRKSPANAARRAPVLDSGDARPSARTGAPKTKSPARGGGGGGRRYKRVHPFKRAWRWLWWRCKRVILACAVIGFLVLGWIWMTLPAIDTLAHVTKAPSILVRAKDGQIIGSYGDVYGEYISYEDMPRALLDAVVATEDRNFYHHFGVDPLGLLRAVVANMRAGHVAQGGSTITQQLAKNVFLTPERTLWRKLREALLAFKLEGRFSKEQILTIYLNRVYLGAGTYGVDAAAHRYFGKSARELNLSEAAVITGLLKAPSRYAPTGNPVLARKRAEQILLNMEDAGYLKPKQVERGRAELATLLGRKSEAARGAPYFSDWIVDQLPDFIGNAEADLEVTTTLDPALQRVAEAAVTKVMDEQGEAKGAQQAALVSMTPDGAVVALVGGRNYNESQYNRAVQAKRQPGSAFKLFVYLTALEGGMTPDSEVADEPIRIGKWQPQNYKSGYQGTMSLRSALAQSINTVAVSLAERFGRANVIRMASRLGVTSELNPDPSLALGSNELTLMELTTAYAHLAAEGVSVSPYGILEIKTAEGRVLYTRRPQARGEAVSRETVGMMNDMLMGVVQNGTGRSASIGREAAGKTGTTSDYKDAWFMGFTPDLATGVWVGNDDATPMKKVTGGSLPAAIWRGFMQPALAHVPPHPIYVARGGFSLQGLLPWHEAPGAPQPAARPATATQEGQDLELGDSFWEKLEQSGTMERSYPSQPQR